ncbi:MAG: K(+)-transporting ATPase subunit C [Bacteroidetes bacterium]|nr:K(+)-transporting ATPase subunit C [Bacteroidota bacterium]
MKTYLLPSLKLTGILILICSVIYPLLVYLVSLATPGHGNGNKLMENGVVIGYENIGQKFTDERYFQGRPSAVDYNAAGSAGSNKGPSNAEYLAGVKARIDTFLIHNPGIQAADIPADLVTASGSGLDPNISVQAARVQIARIAKLRGKSEKELNALVDRMIEHPLLGLFGPEKINVLKLNIALTKI